MAARVSMMAAQVSMMVALAVAYPGLRHKELDVSFPRVEGGGDAAE
jgi:hypothetical protein